MLSASCRGSGHTAAFAPGARERALVNSMSAPQQDWAMRETEGSTVYRASERVTSAKGQGNSVLCAQF